MQKFEESRWWNKPLRIVQTVLREPDIVDYDADAVLDYVVDKEANVFVVNGGGIVSFYDSKVEPHYHNRFANGIDVLKELIPKAHARGIKVLVRLDFRGAKKYIYERSPSWFGQEDDGTPRMTAGVYAACPNSPYRWEHAFKIIEEVLGGYEVDGIWENAASFDGVCYCPNCREKFRRDEGLEIPPSQDWSDPAFRKYYKWRHKSKGDQTRAWRKVIKSCGDDKAYCAEYPGPNVFDWAFSGALDIDLQEQYLDFLLGCCFVISRNSFGSPFLQTPIWGSMELVKYLKNVNPSKTPVVLFSHLEQTSRYTAEPKRDLEVWLEGALSTGGSLWDCTFNGQHPSSTYDTRNVDVIKQYFQQHAKHEKAFIGCEEVADVAIIHSQRSQDRFGSDDPRIDRYITHIRGWEQALLEEHITFTLVPDTKATVEKLAQYKCVILPNQACMDDTQTDAIKEYVRGGGQLIATFETSLYDGDFEKRQNHALADVLGIRYTGITRGPLPVSYQWLQRPHPIADAFANTDLIVNNGFVCYVDVLESASLALTLVPEIIQQHPENAWVPEMDIPVPTVLTNEFGKGRTVYIANQGDRLYLTDGHPDYKRVLTESLKWLLAEKNEDWSVAVSGPSSVYVSCLGQRDPDKQMSNLRVALINVTGSPKRPLHAPVAVNDIEIKLNSPQFQHFRWATIISSGKVFDLKERSPGSSLSVVVDTLEAFEVVEFHAENAKVT